MKSFGGIFLKSNFYRNDASVSAHTDYDGKKKRELTVCFHFGFGASRYVYGCLVNSQLIFISCLLLKTVKPVRISDVGFIGKSSFKSLYDYFSLQFCFVKQFTTQHSPAR